LVLCLLFQSVLRGALTSIDPKATEWILSGIHVCGPSVDTAGALPLAWDILALAVNSILFLLAMGRFVKHVIDMRRMLHRWTFSDLMGVLVRDSIVYFLMYVCRRSVRGVNVGTADGVRTLRNLLATIFLMISVWSIPSNVRQIPFALLHPIRFHSRFP